MFSGEFRIKRGDFPKGRPRIFASTPTLSINVFPNGGHPRATVVVSGKVSKKAVRRNTIKRYIREEVKRFLPTLPPGRYVFYAKKGAGTADKKTLREDVGVLFAKINSKIQT